MRIIIDMGHTPTSPGAHGYLDELDCDRAAGERIIAELERRGHTVYNSTPPDYMAYPDEINYRCSYANSLNNIDLFCSLHLNAGGGSGTEVLYSAGDSTGRSYAAQISANVAQALDITDRGAKSNDWVGVIRNTRHTAVLIEFCFVDSWSDAEAWHACPWGDLVGAVCDGIEGHDWEDDDMANADPQAFAEANYHELMDPWTAEDKKKQWGPNGKGSGDYMANGYNIRKWDYENLVEVKNTLNAINKTLVAINKKLG